MTTSLEPPPLTFTSRAPSLVCPECREAARDRPPHDWPLLAWRQLPRYSHRDGTPLCPVIGADGYEPASAIPAR